MSESKTFAFKGRVLYKHFTEAEWNLPENSAYIPLSSEKIIYDIDDTHTSVRIKIGDGVTSVTQLPFVRDLSVANWARQVEIPSPVYTGDTNPDELTDENGESLEGRYPMWFDPNGDSYTYELTPEDKEEIASIVAGELKYYCHHIQLVFRDPQDALGESTGKGMFAANFDVINTTPNSYSFEFNRADPNKPENPDYREIDETTAIKLWKLYRAMQLSDIVIEDSELNCRLAAGTICMEATQSPINAITTNYEQARIESSTHPFYGKWIRVIQVVGYRIGQDGHNRHHLMSSVSSIGCGMSEVQQVTIDGKTYRQEVNPSLTEAQFIEEFNRVKAQDGALSMFFCRETLICRDNVEELKFEVGST